jgi:diguanylate cyclase (GGDEF)-like protein/PAS domain S-box-containing protein
VRTVASMQSNRSYYLGLTNKSKSTVENDGQIGKYCPLSEPIENNISEQQIAEYVKFRALVDHSSDFIAMVGMNGIVQYLNRTGRQMVGLALEGPIEIDQLEQMLTPESWRRYKTTVRRTISSTDYWHGELACWNRSIKRETPVDSTLFVVRDPNTNEPLCYSVVFRDITQRKQLDKRIRTQIGIISQSKTELELKHKELLQLNAELERANLGLTQLAATDSLTTLNNRHAFELRIVDETSRCFRFNKPCSILLLDVDHFKLFNDTYGHLEGDQVLRDVALILKSEARAVDFVARYGGEEFVFILPETNADEAIIASERIRGAVEKFAWNVRAITISGGISTWSPAQPTGWHLVSLADQALYSSKSAGRNRVIHAKDLPISA